MFHDDTVTKSEWGGEGERGREREKVPDRWLSHDGDHIQVGKKDKMVS
jgi:hypothetical protein